MTVIASLISNDCSVHASDSLLLTGEVGADGLRIRHHRSGMAKIIIVSRFRGAMSWWGRVSAGIDWNLYDWLVERVAWLQTHTGAISAQEYAGEIAHHLNQTLAQSHLNNTDGTKGLGIHFTCYEQSTAGIWIPELYLITNERGADNEGRYEAAGHFESYRRTYFDLKHITTGEWDVDYARHANTIEREFVRDFLQARRLISCNGTPRLFDQLAQETWNNLGDVAPPVTTFQNNILLSRLESLYPLTLVRAIVDEQIRTQAPMDHTVAHPCHDLVISQAGEYFSHTSLSAIPDDRITSLQLALADARVEVNTAGEAEIVKQVEQRCKQLGRDLITSLAAAPSLAQL